MKRQTTTEDGKKILRIIPETDFVASHIDEIKATCWEMLSDNPDATHVVLDVRGVDLVDSLGVNMIVGLYREAETDNKTLEIVGAGKNFMDVAGFFRLGSLFPIHAKNRAKVHAKEVSGP